MKEVTKNALHEKLQNLSKEELIDIIAELSSVYIMARVFGQSAMMMSDSLNSCKIDTKLSDAVTAVATNLANREFSTQQICLANDWLFKVK